MPGDQQTERTSHDSNHTNKMNDTVENVETGLKWLIVGIALLAGVYSTGWFGTWPAKLTGGVGVAATVIGLSAVLINGLALWYNAK